MQKNILICLEQLNIGGVETYVFNQSQILRERGYNVFVLAKKGTYAKKLKQIGVKVIDFEFPLLNNIDFVSSKKIEKIIKKYNITEVHINQYPCILSVLPACIKCNIPYVAYVHSILFDVFDWFINTFPIYKELFSIYFNNSNKIITITEETKNKHSKYFSIPLEKYLVKNNSINLKEFKSTNKKIKMNNFLIMGRISNEKLIPIKNGIKLFSEYSKIAKQKCSLNFLGEGPCIQQVKEYLNEYNITNYTFLGATDNVIPYLEEADVIIGVDRCILEALTMKKLAIISGYTGFKGLITKENIEISSKENFSGNNLKNGSIKKTIKQLSELNEQEIKKITEENYKFIKNNLDIRKNIYTIEKNKNIDYLNNYQKIIKISKIFEPAKSHNTINYKLINFMKKICKKIIRK